MRNLPPTAGPQVMREIILSLGHTANTGITPTMTGTVTGGMNNEQPSE